MEKKKTVLTVLVVVGGILCMGPFYGQIGSAVAMLLAFRRMGEGAPEVTELAGDINMALFSTVWGVVAALVGLSILIPSAVGLSRMSQEERRSNEEQKWK